MARVLFVDDGCERCKDDPGFDCFLTVGRVVCDCVKAREPLVVKKAKMIEGGVTVETYEIVPKEE